MATGFNWVPPLAVIDALGGKMEFLSLVNNRINREIMKCIDINGLFHDIPDKSIYDYRRYFKARW
jgi:3-hydroxyacyl-CoA dehydrogenase